MKFSLVFLLVLALCSVSNASQMTVTEYEKAAVAVTQHLLDANIINAMVLCEDHRANYIICTASFNVTRTDSVDLEEEGIREENIGLKCANSYAYYPSNNDVQELESDCY